MAWDSLKINQRTAAWQDGEENGAHTWLTKRHSWMAEYSYRVGRHLKKTDEKFRSEDNNTFYKRGQQLETVGEFKKANKFLFRIGSSPSLYQKMQLVARKYKCIIFIRATNPGSTKPLRTGSAYGKPLYIKGKSSASPFTGGNICFLANLCKKNKSLEEIVANQESILSTLKGHHVDGSDQSDRDLVCIHKTVTADEIKTNAAYISKPVALTRTKIALGPYLLVKVGTTNTFKLYLKIPPDNSKLPPSEGGLTGTQFRVLLAKLKKMGGVCQTYSRLIDGYVPVYVLAERDDSNDWPLVADYDLFAVCPYRPYLVQQEKQRFYFPRQVSNKGCLSKFEEEIADALNKAVTLSVARHGCEVNNYQYTSELSDLLAIYPKSKGIITNVKKTDITISWHEYFRWITSPGPEGDISRQYFFPLNFNWGTQTYAVLKMYLDKLGTDGASYFQKYYEGVIAGYTNLNGDKGFLPNIKLAAEMCKTVATSSGAVNVTEVQDQFAHKPAKQSGTSYPWVQKLNALVQNFSGQMDFSD